VIRRIDAEARDVVDVRSKSGSGDALDVFTLRGSGRRLSGTPRTAEQAMPVSFAKAHGVRRDPLRRPTPNGPGGEPPNRFGPPPRIARPSAAN